MTSWMTTFLGHEMHLHITGKSFPVKDGMLMGGKADPYIRMWAGDPATLEPLTKTVDAKNHTTFMGLDRELKIQTGQKHSNDVRLLYDGVNDYQKNTLNPDFPFFKFQVDAACAGSDILSPQKSILIEFWDWDGAGMRPDFMGFVVVSPCDLIKSAANKHLPSELAKGSTGSIPLIKGEAGHTWSGAITIEEVRLTGHNGKSHAEVVALYSAALNPALARESPQAASLRVQFCGGCGTPWTMNRGRYCLELRT